MYNCLKMPTLRFRKLLASLFVFAGLSVCTQAATYWWTGGAAGNWSAPENWSTGPDIEHLTAQTAGAPVPGSDTTDIVNLISAATITVDSAVQIKELLIPSEQKQEPLHILHDLHQLLYNQIYYLYNPYIYYNTKFMI